MAAEIIFFKLSSEKKKNKQVSYSVFLTVIFSQQSVSHHVTGWMLLYFYTFISSLHKKLFGILVANVRNYLSNKIKVLAMLRKWLKSLKSLPSKLRSPCEGLICKSSSAWESHRPEFLDIIAFLNTLLLIFAIPNPRWD